MDCDIARQWYQKEANQNYPRGIEQLAFVYQLGYSKDGKIILDTECNPLHGPRVEQIIKALENGETPEKQQYVDEEIFAAVKDVESVNADGKDYDVTVVDDKVIAGRAY